MPLVGALKTRLDGQVAAVAAVTALACVALQVGSGAIAIVGIVGALVAGVHPPRPQIS